jgi:hypothetical protein
MQQQLPFLKLYVTPMRQVVTINAARQHLTKAAHRLSVAVLTTGEVAWCLRYRILLQEAIQVLHSNQEE